MFLCATGLGKAIDVTFFLSFFSGYPIGISGW